MKLALVVSLPSAVQEEVPEEPADDAVAKKAKKSKKTEVAAEEPAAEVPSCDFSESGRSLKRSGSTRTLSRLPL